MDPAEASILIRFHYGQRQNSESYTEDMMDAEVATLPPPKHAILSPSKTDQWWICPGSIPLSQGASDESSPYALEGTAAHTLAAICLETHIDAHEVIGQNVEDTNIQITEEMADHVMGYVNRVKALVEQGGILLVEERVPLTHITGEPNAEGTSDVVILREDAELIIDDFKYGRGVEVKAEKNKQMMMYALGVLEKHQMWEQYTSVRMIIDQPRIGVLSEWVCSVEELKQFQKEAGEKARPIMARLNNPNLPPLPLVPNEKACRFCRAKGICPALAAQVGEALVDGFSVVDDSIPKNPKVAVTATGDKLGEMMHQADLAELWIKAVRAQTEIELLAGRPVTGYKLVKGKKGNRQWDDGAAVEELMKKKFRMSNDDMYDMTLISPTTAEKKMKEENPKRWEQLKAHIVQNEGALSVAEESDKRPAVLPEAPTDGFEAVSDEVDVSDLL